MTFRPGRIVAIVLAFVAWLEYSKHMREWVTIAGLVVIFGSAQLISNYYWRKKQIKP